MTTLSHMSATKPLSLNNGQTWRTVKGRLVEIISLDLTGGDFPLRGEFIAGADGLAKISWKGLTVCGDQLSEQIHIEPKPAPIVSDYLAAAIEDELVLAKLLGWQNFTKPGTIGRTVWLMGTHSSRNGHVRNGSVPMPSWRRDWSAGELISRCKLTIAPTDGGVAVHAETGPVFRAIYSEHPSEDDAIRFAMCKAAIAYLESR